MGCEIQSESFRKKNSRVRSVGKNTSLDTKHWEGGSPFPFKPGTQLLVKMVQNAAHGYCSLIGRPPILEIPEYVKMAFRFDRGGCDVSTRLDESEAD